MPAEAQFYKQEAVFVKVMGIKKTRSLDRSALRGWLGQFPQQLFSSLKEVSESRQTSLHMTGGGVRDWLLGEVPTDLDFTIEHGAVEFGAALKRKLRGGTLVELGRQTDDTCMLVLGNHSLDISGYRNEAKGIEEDLEGRDFTINALGVSIDELLGESTGEIIVVDPLDGLQDMDSGLIRACPNAFVDDPLRMLRAFRFFAQLGYEIEIRTLADITQHAGLIGNSAAERISYEWNCIMTTNRAFEAIREMAGTGLLEKIAPELWLGYGIEQPSFHHLDVLQHNLETLNCIEQVIARPERYFPGCADPLEGYLEIPDNRLMLKWSALFHDVGKPVVKKPNPKKQDRITFYNHDGEGSRLFMEFSVRQKWSKRARQRVAAMITMHMHPFHLLNSHTKDGELSRRARLKICRRAGPELPGLFLLAMADCLAGQGVDRPAGMEEELAQLFCELDSLYRQAMEPLLAGPKLLTGEDLIATLGMVPGPLFRTVLEEVETARLEGDIADRDEALAWVKRYLHDRM